MAIDYIMPLPIGLRLSVRFGVHRFCDFVVMFYYNGENFPWGGLNGYQE